MAFQTKNNTGSLFKNDKKENERHPEFNGSAVIDGKSYWVAGFVKTAESGKRWTSLAFTPKQKPKVEEEDVDQSKPTHRPPPVPPKPSTPVDPDEYDGVDPAGF